MSNKPMTLRELRRWVSALQPKGDRDAQAKHLLIELVKEAQKKMRDIECYRCGCFDYDTGACTMPSYERIYACPYYSKEENDGSEQRTAEKDHS